MKISNLSNSVWSVFDVLLYPFLYLLFTPFLMNRLGSESYGLFILVNTIVVFMQILNFGLGVNTLKNVASLIGQSAFEEISVVIKTNMTLALLIALFCIFLGFVLAQCSIHFHLFNIPLRLQYTSLICISLAGVIASIKLLEQVFTNVLNAFEKIALVARYNSLIRITNLFFVLVLIQFNVGLVSVFVTTIVLYLIGMLILYQFLIKETSSFSFRFLLKKSYIAKELIYSRWIWIQSILVIIAFQCDKFLIAHWFGVTAFGYYSVVSTIFNHIHLALTAIVPWAMPQIAKRIAKGRDVNYYYSSFRSLVHIVAYIGILIFYFSYEHVFTIWMGEDIAVNLVVYLRFFMVFELVFMASIAPYFLLNATGNEKLATLNTFIFSMLSLIGLFVGYLVGHTIAACIFGTICAISLSMIVQQILINRVLKFNLKKETLGVLSPMFSLSLFILIDNSMLFVRVLTLIVSLILFVYFYFYEYPVHFNLLKSNNLNEKDAIV